SSRVQRLPLASGATRARSASTSFFSPASIWIAMPPRWLRRSTSFAHPLPQPHIARRGAYVDRARARDDVPRRIGDRPVAKPIARNVQTHALRLTGTQRDPLEVGERAHREIDSGGRRLGRAEVSLHYLVGRACANVANRAADVESSVGRAPHRQT